MQTILKLIGDKSRAQFIRGYFRGMDGLRALVDFDEGRVPAHPVTEYRPAINEPVWVEVLDGVAYMHGPTINHSPDATVVSVASGLAVVSTDTETNIDATYNDGVTLSAGQQVRLQWGGEKPHVIGVKSTSPTLGTPGGGGGSSGGEFTKTFTATQSGSYGSSWWTQQVWSSDNNVGAWFYGSKIADTIPAGAEILSINIYLSVVQIFGSPANFALHNHASRPGGAPVLGSLTALAPTSGWRALPESFGNALRRGGTAKGIGFSHGGYHVFRSVGQDGQSGALRIRYRT